MVPAQGVNGPGAPCDLDLFQNTIVNPGGNFSQISEPAAAINRDTAFFTWNWGAALSLNSGETWSYVNPYTKFPSVDGGFCCDQRTVYVPSRDMTVWYLQYVKSSTTNLGHCRIAVSSSRSNLAANTWHSWTFAPDNFGFGTGEWLDYPDVVYTNNHFYCASNIFRVSDNGYVDSVVWKMGLTDLDDAGGLSAVYWTRSSASAIGGGASYRFAQGSTGTMYMASHVSSSAATIRVFRNSDSALSTSMFSNDRTIAPWNGGSYVATAPNGTNWAGRIDSRITGGYANSTNYGFMWSIGRRPTASPARPQVYVRVSEFNTSNNALNAEHEIWSSTLAFMYPAATTNASGEPGYTCAFGQGNGAAGFNPTNFYRVVDPGGCGVNFGGGSFPVWFTGNSPSGATWGDYFTVQRHNTETNTFVATGMARGATAQQPRYIWFGKEEDTPRTPIVTVQDNILGPVASIVTTHTDLDGNKNGTTPFTRRYTWNGRYEFTAPATMTSGSNTYVFCNWRVDVNGGTNWVDRAAGQLTLTADGIGSSNDRAEAVYALQSRITVQDRNVSGSVPITVGTRDLDGLQNGNTTFVRRYKAGGPYTFTAPATAGSSQPFRRWYLSGIAQPIGNRVLSVSPATANTTIEAEYCNYSAGSYTTYGSGCRGSNGLVPRHDSTSQPDTGLLVRHTIADLRGSTPAVMFLGFSKTLWNGIPLPLSLGFIGSNPNCNVLTEAFLELPMSINASGAGSVTFRVGSDPALIGQLVFTQVIAADLFLPDPIPLVVSNGLEMKIGGSSIGGQRCP